jgi:hypothetical protein
MEHRRFAFAVFNFANLRQLAAPPLICVNRAAWLRLEAGQSARGAPV